MPDPHEGTALVPGELRGFRQFQLGSDGLYPLVHARFGRWDGQLERARCATGGDHPSPAPDCRCGLYAWYLPGSATVALGPASAVVAARGRCVLGDRGFRAAEARIEAVTLPAAVRWNPRAAARTRELLAEVYPRARVYRSARRMLKDFPPQDVRALGVDPPRDHSRGYRAAAAALFAAAVLPAYSLAAVPRGTVADTVVQWWPLLMLTAVLWQAGLVWLLTRLMALQTTNPAPATAAAPASPRRRRGAWTRRPGRRRPAAG
ncbi:MAG TPA: hypothetical protein VLB29_00320 [Nocardioidaceae bacterium]|nr:hypothetical protein [Nocardioidaceae bacterium]